MKDVLLLIFTRNPELGKCKTRLAKSVGDENALEIYKILLNHTLELTRGLNCDKAIYYSVKIRENDIWNEKVYQKFEQKGEDLGERMLNAFNNGFESGYEKIVIVGSDILDLTEEIIYKAFDSLKFNEIVLGPAEDGGYYLLGMNKLCSTIFLNKEWGTSSVLNDTLTDLKDHKVKLLEELNDIDTYNDMKRHAILKPFLINDKSNKRNN